jgi:outer membrane protein OmpU
MKKILLGTTAVIALGTMTTEAFAADKIKLNVGGFMKEYLGITNNDDVASTNSGASRDKDISQFTDTEIFFTGSTTLDSGIKVAATIEVEADQGAAGTTGPLNVDRSFLTISSDAMGSLAIGSTPHFGEGNHVRVPNASGNFDWDDLPAWVGTATSATASTTGFAYSAKTIGTQMGGDSAKLSYTSPTFSGVTVGASYTAAEIANASDARRATGTLSDGYTYGVRYSGDLGGAAVKADVTRTNLGTTNEEFTHGGLTVGMAGFTVGGGYSDINDTATGSSAADGNTWELGVSYATGPYSVSAAYMKAENKDTTATAGDNKDTAWKVAATYDMGAGVALTANYFHLKSDPEGTGTTTATGKSSSASGVIAGIEVGF